MAKDVGRSDLARTLVFNPGTHPAPRWFGEAAGRQGTILTYVTAFGVKPHSRLLNAPGRLGSEVRKRALPLGFEGAQIVSGAKGLDVLAVGFQRAGQSRRQERTLEFRNRLLQRKAISIARKERPGTLLAPATTCDSLFQACPVSTRRILYAPLPQLDFGENLLSEEMSANPKWADFVQHGRTAPEERRRLEAEVRGADVILAASEFSAKSYRGNSGTARVVWRHLGVNDRHLVWRRSGRHPSDTEFRLIYVGQVNQRKGLSYLFEALSEFRKVLGNYSLTVVGPDYRGMARELKTAYPGVNARFLGSLGRAEIYELMSSSHAFVFPSLLEGFGLAMVEAMACGLPVVATDRSAAPELGVGTTTGLLVKPGDAESLAKAIFCYREDESLRIKHGLAAAERANALQWESYGDSVWSEIREAAT